MPSKNNSHSRLQIEYLHIGAIKPDPKNPRIHTKKQLRQLTASINQFGFNVPVLVNSENKLIAGHGRLLAAKGHGIEEIPIIRLEHLTEAAAMAFMVADNRLTENADWNQSMLADIFIELDKSELDFSLDITGFEISEIDLIIESSDSTPDEDKRFLFLLGSRFLKSEISGF